MNVADTLILANLAIANISDIESSESFETCALYFYTSGSIFTSLPLFGLIGVLVFKVISKIVQLPCYKRLQLCICQHMVDATTMMARLMIKSSLKICDNSDHELLESTEDIKDQKERCNMYHSFS